MIAEGQKILFITGYGRSGSTILDNILGQIDGFFSVGELSDIWERGSEGLCSCGEPLKRCHTWVRIFVDAFGVEPGEFDFGRMLHLAERSDRFKHLSWLKAQATRNVLGPRRGLSEYMEVTAKLYQSVFRITGARVMVDSSKHPSHGYLLELIDVPKLYILHLVRDSRASAYSWQRKKPDRSLPEGHMRQLSPLQILPRWTLNHLACEWLWNADHKQYLRLRYEEFANSPKTTIERILRFLNEHESAAPFVSDQAVELENLHGIAGNPTRFKSGPVGIRPDNEWKFNMGWLQRVAITALTGPWLVRYGYQLNTFGRRVPAGKRSE